MALLGSAGGVVWRADGGGLALVHRPRRDDWSLPKGKLDPGESWHAAAVREVAEETGFCTRILGFAGAKLFLERETPKLVLYWHMQAVRAATPPRPEEIDGVVWLSPRRALEMLDHASDQRLLLRALTGFGWRERPPRALGPDAGLGRRLVVDRPCTDAELAPWVRRVEVAVRHEERWRGSPGGAAHSPGRAGR